MLRKFEQRRGRVAAGTSAARRVLSQIGAVLIAMLAVASAVGAQETRPETNPETKKVDPVVVTATTVPTPAEQLGVSLNVITGEDLKTYHYSTVDDAFRNIPGCQRHAAGRLRQAVDPEHPGRQREPGADPRRRRPGLEPHGRPDGPVRHLPGPDRAHRGDPRRAVHALRRRRHRRRGQHHHQERARGPSPPPSRTWAATTTPSTTGSRSTARTRSSTTRSTGSHLESNGQFQNDNSNINAVSVAASAVTLPFDSSLSVRLPLQQERHRRAGQERLPAAPAHRAHHQPERQAADRDHGDERRGQTRPVEWWESRGRFGRYTNNQGFQDPVDPGFDFDVPFRSQVDVERREVELAQLASSSGRGARARSGSATATRTGTTRACSRLPRATCPGSSSSSNFACSTGSSSRAAFRIEDDSVFGKATTGQGSVAFVIKETGTRLRGSAGHGLPRSHLQRPLLPGLRQSRTCCPSAARPGTWAIDQNLWQNRIRLKFDLVRHPLHRRHHVLRGAADRALRRPRQCRQGPLQGRRGRAERSTSCPNLVASFTYTYTDTDNLSTERPLARIPRNSGQRRR